MPTSKLILAQLAALDHRPLRVPLDHGCLLADQDPVHDEEDSGAEGNQDGGHHEDVGQQQCPAEVGEDHGRRTYPTERTVSMSFTAWSWSTLWRR